MAKRVAAVQISDRNPHADEDSDRGEEPSRASDVEDFEVESARYAASGEADLQRRKISKPRSLLQRVRGAGGSNQGSQSSTASTVGSLFAGLPTNPFASLSTVSLSKSTSSSVDEGKTKMQGLNRCFVDAAQQLFERNPTADFCKLFEQYRKHLQSFKPDAAVANAPVFNFEKPASAVPAQAASMPLFPLHNPPVEPSLKPSAPLFEFKPTASKTEVVESPSKPHASTGSPMKESTVPVETDKAPLFSFGLKPMESINPDAPKPAVEQPFPSLVSESTPMTSFSFATEAKPTFPVVAEVKPPVFPIEVKPPVLPVEVKSPVFPTEVKPPVFPTEVKPIEAAAITSATQTPAKPEDPKPMLSFGMSPAPAPFNFNLSTTTSSQAPLASPLTTFSFGNASAFTAPQLPKFSFGVPATTAAPGTTPFSFSAVPAVAVGKSGHEQEQESHDADDDNDIPEDERESFTLTRTTSEALKTGAGEEHEETVHEQRCKVFLLTDKDKGWMDLGVGNLKVNRDRREEAQGQSRLLCRAEGSGRIVLNTRISPLGTEATHIEGKKEVALLAFGPEGKPCKYLIRVKTIEEAVQLRTAIQAEVDHVKAAKN